MGSIKATREHKDLQKLKLQQLDKVLHDWFVMKHSEASCDIGVHFG
jgi:hypothetical protein